jgi:hypothetical protein
MLSFFVVFLCNTSFIMILLKTADTQQIQNIMNFTEVMLSAGLNKIETVSCYVHFKREDELN